MCGEEFGKAYGAGHQGLLGHGRKLTFYPKSKVVAMEGRAGLRWCR